MVGYSYYLKKKPVKIDWSIVSADYHLRKSKHLKSMAMGEEKQNTEYKIHHWLTIEQSTLK